MAALFPPGAVEIRGGLRYLSPDARKAFLVGFEAVSFLNPKSSSMTLTLDAGVGVGGSAVIEQLLSAGYVVIVSSWANRIVATKNPLLVEDLAGPSGDGEWAILGGPAALLSIAAAGVQVPGPSWVFPVVVGVGVASIIWLLRR